MLVTRIIGDCPGCKSKNSFGNVDVFGNTLQRGCHHCEYSVEIPLPEITKSILYLDQFFFSHAFHEADEKFVDAANRIGEAAHQQLLTTPYSSLHEEETQMWKHREELREFIRKTARGAKFATQYHVEKTQVIKAFQAWLKGRTPEYQIDERDAFVAEVHKWDGYFYIDVRGNQLDPDELRASKQKAIEALVAIFDDWRKDTMSFEQDVEVELLAGARGYVNAYSELVTRIGTGDFSALLHSPARSSVVENMMDILGRDKDFNERLRTCGLFLRSDHFKNTPFHWLSARMYATVKDMVRRGAYKNVEEAKRKLKGFFYDVNHIATYAPYCDGVVLDSVMAELVSHPNVDLENRYRVRVFGRRNWQEFLAWLEELKKGLTAEMDEALGYINVKSVGSTFEQLKLPRSE
jgi:hypothetical protein